MEMQSEKNYYEYILGVTAILFFASLLLYLFTNTSFIFSLIFFLFTELILVAQKFTDKVKLENDILEISFYQFLYKTIKIFPSGRISMHIKKQVTFRNGVYYVLEIKQNSKIIFTVDARDGFEENVFKELKSYVERIS